MTSSAYRDVPLGAYSSSSPGHVALELGPAIPSTQVSISTTARNSGLAERLPGLRRTHCRPAPYSSPVLWPETIKRVRDRGDPGCDVYFAPGHLNSIGYLRTRCSRPRKIPRTARDPVHDAVDRGRMRVGKSSKRWRSCEPGAKSTDPYKTNGAEHFELATKLFDDGKLDEAQKTPRRPVRRHRTTAGNATSVTSRACCLWIHTGHEESGCRA